LSKRIDELFDEDDASDANPLHSIKGVSFLENLTKVRDRELRAGNEKLTKLRLTNQSRYAPRTAATAGGRAAKGGKPWDDD
jgi:hypothetical protein